MCIEEYLNDLVEPNFQFDDIALMICAMMTKMHIYVVLKGNFWTSRSNFEYENCPIKLAYMGNGVYIEMICKPPVEPEPKTTIDFDFVDYEDDTPIDVTPKCTPCKQKIAPKNPRKPRKRKGVSTTASKCVVKIAKMDPDLRLDLQDTGLVPDFLNDIPPNCEDLPGPVSTEDNTQNMPPNGEDLPGPVTTEDENDTPPQVHSNIQARQESEDVPPSSENKENQCVVNENKQNLDTEQADNDAHEENKQVESELIDQKEHDAKEENKQVESDVENKQVESDVIDNKEQDGDDSSSQKSASKKGSSAEQSHVDSLSDVQEEDGWESEGTKKRRLRRERRQTKTVETSDGVMDIRTVGIVKRVHRDRQYTCHVCQKVLEMQTLFTKHMTTEHPDSPFKCDFCPKILKSANGLFKHQRSHQYLKHQCEDCQKRFQFPGQLKRHTKLHTKQNMYPCLHCPRQFTDNSTMMIHARTHNTVLKCELCPKSNEKTYNSRYAMDQHQRGMHGDGWDSFCGENFKWKSKYSRHMKKCTACLDERQRRQKARYFFEL